jgi:predicted acetyltransferase
MPILTKQVTAASYDEFSKELHQMLKDHFEEQKTYIPKVLEDPALGKVQDEYIKDLKKIVSARDKQMYLIYEAETIVGLLQISYTVTNKVISIDQFFIKKDFRNKGISGTVLESFISESKKLKFKAITINAFTLDRTRYKLYKTLNFNSHTHVMFTIL